MCLILLVASCNKSNKSSLAGQSILMYWVTRGTTKTPNTKTFIHFLDLQGNKIFLEHFIMIRNSYLGNKRKKTQYGTHYISS